ncbi:MAG: hypothetical protein ACFB10_14855 [Salibacteraceae bacterium]
MLIQDLEDSIPIDTNLHYQQIRFLKKELQKSVERWEVHFQLGQLYFEVVEITQSEYHFRQALAYREAYPAANAGLAALYKKLGKHQLATYHYRKACKLDPGLQTEILTRFFDPQAR